MIITNKQFRDKAWRALRGKWNIFYPIMLFSVVFADAFGLKILYTNFFSRVISYRVAENLTYNMLIPYGKGIILAAIALLFTLAGAAINVGEYRLAGDVLNNEPLRLKTLFPGRVLLKSALMNLIKYLIIMAGSMFFVVPGIIFYCNYAKADYLLANDPTLGPIEALRMSREQMYGKRLPFFSLQLSFMPWAFGIYLILYILVPMIENLTWTGDLIYSVISWSLTAFLLGYIRVTTFAFFRDTENFDYAKAVKDAFNDAREHSEQNEESRREAARKAEEEHARQNEAEQLYTAHHCSRIELQNAGELDRYIALEPTECRESQLRAAYARELMLRFDTDPSALDALLPLCEEYAMDDITDRIIARIYRYGWEGTIGAAAVLSMCVRVLGLLHTGAFTRDPSFAARKQTDVLNIAESVRRKALETDPDGDWRDQYDRVRDICGLENGDSE